MKRSITLMSLLVLVVFVQAQNMNVLRKLRQEFDEVKYIEECYSSKGLSYLSYKSEDDCIPYYLVKKQDKKGVYDEDGNVVITPIKCSDIRQYRNSNSHFYEVQTSYPSDKGNSLYDIKGRLILSDYARFSLTLSKEHNLLKVGNKINDREYGLFDFKGNTILEPKFVHILFFDENSDIDKRYKNRIRATYLDENKKLVVGVIDTVGNIVIPFEYDSIFALPVGSDDYDLGFYVWKYGACGFMTIDGVSILDAGGRFSDIGYFSEGLAYAYWDAIGKYGYISINGMEVLPFEYDVVSEFHNGVARVTKDGKDMLISNPLKVVADNNPPKVKGKAVSTYPAPNSDVDLNIPKGKKANENTFAFIIANENYPMAKVPYALNDGWIFEQYCKTTLGIKEENVKIFEDATGGNIYACIEQIKQIATAYEGDANILFYYAGHAFPDEEKNTAYLLPIDGDSKDIKTGYSLEKLYKELNSVKTKSVICFLDACFSGATREDEMLLAGRGVAIKVKDDVPMGNIIVFTSATGAETAHQYEEKGHGLFTYYLLQKLQETKGDVTLGDLAEHIRKMVRRKSVLINQKMQTPTVIPSISLSQSWKSLKLVK